MLTMGRYKSNPMAAHMVVPGLEGPMFERWLALFGATAGDLFAEGSAAVFRLKAERIAESLKMGLFFRPAQQHRDRLINLDPAAGTPPPGSAMEGEECA